MTPDGSSAKRITVFTTPVCPFCDHAKAYLTGRDLAYTEVDVSTDRAGLREMVVMTGQRGVPVVRVGDKALVGWNVARFRELFDGDRSRER